MHIYIVQKISDCLVLHNQDTTRTTHFTHYPLIDASGHLNICTTGA